MRVSPYTSLLAVCVAVTLAGCVATEPHSTKPDSTEPHSSPEAEFRFIDRDAASLKGPNNAARGLFFSRDGSKLAVFGKDVAQVWHTTSWRLATEPLVHGDGLIHAQFNAAGTRLLTVSRINYTATDQKGALAKVWDIDTGKLAVPPIRHRELPISDAAISPDGQIIATCNHLDTSIHLWSADTGRLIRSLKSKASVHWVEFHQIRQRLMLISTGQVITGEDEGSFRTQVWDVKQGAVKTVLPNGDVSPDNGSHASAKPIVSANHRIVIGVGVGFAVYDLDYGKLIATIDLDTDQYRLIHNFSISPKGDFVDVAGQFAGGAQSIWNLKTGDKFDITDFALFFDMLPMFDHQSEVFAVGGLSAGIWDLRSRKRIRPLPSSDHFTRVAFNHDGSTLAIAGTSTVVVLTAKPKVVGPARWKR